MALALAHPASQAQSLNKCIINGKTSYQQDPCPAGTGGAVTIAPASGRSHSAATQTTSTESTPPTTGADPMKQRLTSMANARRVREIDRDIDRKQSEIRDLRAALNAENARLRLDKRSSANNLAGATWEQSLSAEMQANAARYQVQIDAVQNDIKELRDERRTLQ